MKALTLFAALTCAAALPLQAQVVYRCGNTYSERVCGDAQAIEARDARSDEQRDSALDAQRRHDEMAEQLARDRQKAEAQPVAATGISGRGEPALEEPAATGDGKSSKKAERRKRDFKAVVPRADKPEKNKQKR